MTSISGRPADDAAHTRDLFRLAANFSKERTMLLCPDCRCAEGESHSADCRNVERVLIDDHPSDTDGALTPRSTGLWPSGVPLPSELVEITPVTYLEKQLTRQLAEAKAALAAEQATVRQSVVILTEYQQHRDELQAALDRERADKEALMKFFDENPHALGAKLQAALKELESERAASAEQFEVATGMVADANAARLRAEAGAAVMRDGLQSCLTEIALGPVGCIGSLNSHYCPQIRVGLVDSWRTILSTDTGARLAAVLEDVRKMPCETPGPYCWECSKSDRPKDKWCLRCRLVDAMEGQT